MLEFEEAIGITFSVVTNNNNNNGNNSKITKLGIFVYPSDSLAQLHRKIADAIKDNKNQN